MEDKTHLKSETAYFMMLQEGEEARVYLKDDVDAVIAAKDAEIASLEAQLFDDEGRLLKTGCHTAGGACLLDRRLVRLINYRIGTRMHVFRGCLYSFVLFRDDVL